MRIIIIIIIKIPSKEVLEFCCLFAILLEKYGFRNF